MTLQRKLALFLLVASLAPVAGVGFPILAWAQRELGRRSSAEHLARARSGAASVAADLAQIDSTLAAVAESWRPDGLDASELRGLLLVVSRRLPVVDASAMWTLAVPRGRSSRRPGWPPRIRSSRRPARRGTARRAVSSCRPTRRRAPERGSPPSVRWRVRTGVPGSWRCGSGRILCDGGSTWLPRKAERPTSSTERSARRVHRC